MFSVELTKENHKLRQQLREQASVLQKISTLFTASQMKKIRNPNMAIRWTKKDMKNAEMIYRAGPSAYELLLQKNYPLPVMDTMNRWIEMQSKKADKKAAAAHRWTENMEDNSGAHVLVIELHSDDDNMKTN